MRDGTVYWEDIRKAVQAVPDVHRLYRKTILITGGTGIIGSAAADCLISLNREENAGIRIILAGRNEKRLRNVFGDTWDKDGIQFLPFDMARIACIETEADYYIHCAGNASPELYRKHPVETLMETLNGLNALLQSAQKKPGSRVLQVSTSEVYGNRYAGNPEPFRESEYGYVDILSSRACYPNGKRAAETLCASYREEYGVDFTTARPGYVYGPCMTDMDNRASSAFIRDAAAGMPIVMKSQGLQKRSYCYTADYASALLTILLNGMTGEAYNISNRESIVTIREFAEAAAEAGSVELIRAEPSEDERKSYTPMEHAVLDSTKLEDLGWKGMWNIKAGISHTLETLKGIHR